MHTELIKSLVDAGFSEQEAKDMLIEKAKEPETKGKESEGDDDWSEEKESELEKACSQAKEIYDTYKSKRPVPKKEVTEKSGEPDLIKSIETPEVQSRISDIVKGVVSEMENSFASKLSGIQKSLEPMPDIISEVATLKDKIDNFGKQTPPQKSIMKADAAILEKSLQYGVSDDKGAVHFSQRIPKHKIAIGEELQKLCLETEGSLQKSLETDLMNYVAGGNSVLGDVAKRTLRERKNIIVE
jgi:hypothetical protein